ncbi:MAG: methyltransferase domain-containing protein [Verrucomicrobia bacterium]|nr:methyltransferase domain-containing protein [Verrucomicrobiota bacterium]
MPEKQKNGALVFARNFIAHPQMLGSAIPSSSFLINRLLGKINWGSTRIIVEFGPGTGCFTGEILKRLRPDGTLIVIEMNPAFVRHLQNNIRDPRLRTFQGSAENVAQVLECAGIQNVDYVISGIPFSTMPPDVRTAILKSTSSVLAADGRMLVYQFSKKVLPHLQQSFSRVETDFEAFNILPARLFYCEK